jgi:hypothetical protein
VRGPSLSSRALAVLTFLAGVKQEESDEADNEAPSPVGKSCPDGRSGAMRNLRRRLKRLEVRRPQKREPRIVTRCEEPDGTFSFWESRPSDCHDEDAVEITLVYEDRAPLAS